MAAANANRKNARQQGDIETYTGASGRQYFQGTLVARNNANALVPYTLGASGDSITFLGVASQNVNLSGNLGTSNFGLDIWKTGVFTFEAQGTGVSAHIGRLAFAIDDQTVGISAAIPRMPIGEIVGIPTSTSYRVRISNFTGTLATNA